MEWKRFNGDKIKGDIISEVEQTLISETAQGSKLKICIGTDSQVKGEVIEFATVIVFVREKRGGFMFIRMDKKRQKMGIKERMIAEVAMSIEIAYKLCQLLERYHVNLEVHADINTNPSFKSNTALSEAMGYILSMGFVFKAKPDAFASSYCANKMVH